MKQKDMLGGPQSWPNTTIKRKGYNPTRNQTLEIIRKQIGKTYVILYEYSLHNFKHNCSYLLKSTKFYFTSFIHDGHTKNYFTL